MSDITLDDIVQTRARIDPYVVETPVWQWRNQEIQAVAPARSEIFLKLELFQHTGTFKPRGAINNMLTLSEEALARGVTAVSAGNHAIAVAYAANILGAKARIVMTNNPPPYRVEKCHAFGVELEIINDAHAAFARVRELEGEGFTFVHPFEGRQTALGTATVGYELCRQVADLDAVIVPIGGGGLCAGISTAVKLLQPNCKVYGVEPTGADSMHRSFAAGEAQSIDAVRTIASSLGAPFAMPYSFALCQAHVDELVLISDEEMVNAMGLLWDGMKLAVEPAGAAATAAMIGPLKEKLEDKRVGVIVCGTNIDVETYAQRTLHSA